MSIILRHLLSVLLLPFVVVILVPGWLLGVFPFQVPAGASIWLITGLRVTGLLLLASGFTLFGWCLYLFARIGRGTLAPWDPTKNLVVIGPYRLVRNPMITGVAAMLIGQTLFWPSPAVGCWAIVFILINHMFFLFVEEPGLEKRFGHHYRAYKNHVPRWIPRTTRARKDHPEVKV